MYIGVELYMYSALFSSSFFGSSEDAGLGALAASFAVGEGD
jgi:hypothetical protein